MLFPWQRMYIKEYIPITLSIVNQVEQLINVDEATESVS